MKVRIVGTDREVEVGEDTIRAEFNVSMTRRRRSRTGQPMLYIDATVPPEAPRIVVTPRFRDLTTMPGKPEPAREVRAGDMVKNEAGSWMRVVRVIPEEIRPATRVVFIDVVPPVRPTRWALDVDVQVMRRRLLDRGDWE